MNKNIISIATSCYNESENLEELYFRITQVFNDLEKYDFEFIIADNKSTDNSRIIIRDLCIKDKRVKAIFNTRNFGPERSGLNALLNTSGIAVVGMVSDLQNPPEIIHSFVKKWEEGYKIVGAVKTNSVEFFIIRKMRNLYYNILRATSSAPPIKNFTGFAIYDRVVIDKFRQLNDPDPFFRGLIAEFGYEVFKIEFTQPARKKGLSTYNLLSLTNYGIMGLISQTQMPLRLATFFGFIFSIISFIVGLWYLIYKLIFWSEFSAGIAPLTIGIFFFSSIQLLFIGILGEYIGSIQNKISNKPLVVEDEKINF